MWIFLRTSDGTDSGFYLLVKNWSLKDFKLFNSKHPISVSCSSVEIHKNTHSSRVIHVRIWMCSKFQDIWFVLSAVQPDRFGAWPANVHFFLHHLQLPSAATECPCSSLGHFSATFIKLFFQVANCLCWLSNPFDHNGQNQWCQLLSEERTQSLLNLAWCHLWTSSCFSTIVFTHSTLIQLKSLQSHFHTFILSI